MGIRNGSWGSDSGLFSFSNLNSNMSSPEQKSALCVIVECWCISLKLTFGTLLCKCVQHRPCWCLWHCFWFEQIQQCCFWNAFIYLVCQNWKGKTTDLYWWYVLYLRYDNPSCSQVFRTRCLTTIYSGHCQCKRPSIIWNTLNQLSKQKKDSYADKI